MADFDDRHAMLTWRRWKTHVEYSWVKLSLLKLSYCSLSDLCTLDVWLITYKACIPCELEVEVKF